jgi:hypothetical protein
MVHRRRFLEHMTGKTGKALSDSTVDGCSEEDGLQPKKTECGVAPERDEWLRELPNSLRCAARRAIRNAWSS